MKFVHMGEFATAIGVTGKSDAQWELLETSFPFALFFNSAFQPMGE